MDWLEPSTPHRPIEAGGEQFAFSDSARPSLPEPRFADSVALPAAVAARLAGTVLATAAGAGNLRGSDATPRHNLHRAASWTQVGATKGYRRMGVGYGARTESVKWVFVQALQRDARRILSAPLLDPRYRTGVEKMELTCNDMRSLYDHFRGVPDVRRAKGRKHGIANVLALAAGATLSGMRGYKDIWVWASTLSQANRARFRCRFRNRRREVPSVTVIRNVMIQVGPEALDRAINNWLAAHYGDTHESIAVDGKTMRGAVVDNDGQQVHVMSAVGHDSKHCYIKKSRHTAGERKR